MVELLTAALIVTLASRSSIDDRTRAVELARTGRLGATTVAGGIRVRTGGLTQLFATWEHKRRSNDTRLDRITLSVAKSFP